jgi:thiamine-monophosphate kinase
VSTGEQALLQSLEPRLNFAPSRRYPVGIGDDAAVRFGRRGERLVLSCDSLVEDVHFSLRYMSLAQVGYKAVAVNLSDCAAMGAVPESVLLDVTFSGRARDAATRVRRLYRGVSRAVRRHGVCVVGGNLSRGAGWHICATVIGRMEPTARPIWRHGARRGDLLWVTGHPGKAAGGLTAIARWGHARAKAMYPSLVRAHVRPCPRIDVGRYLARRGAVHAMIDLSDGLSKDCGALCTRSRLGVVLEQHAVPVAPGLRKLSSATGTPWKSWALHGGEDYELLFAASPRFHPTRAGVFSGVACTCIGRFERSRPTVFLRDAGGVRPLIPKAWDHLC